MNPKGFYNIPEEVLKDLSNFSSEVEKFKSGEVSADHFKPYRVSRGVYSQRGQNRYMVRIKVPGGSLNSTQLRKIAELSEKFGNGVPHVTNRQDFQIHYVELDNVSKILDELASVSLTTKGGGGNTLRNITATPMAGIDKDEVFDVSQYPTTLTEYFLTNPKSFALPRKFKITFSGSSKDLSYATMHDVGFIATKDSNGNEGFKVYGAGGMGAVSRTSILLDDFIDKDKFHIVAEALLNLFDKHGNRRNKHKARLRFLVDKFGKDEFIKMYKEELKLINDEGRASLALNDIPQFKKPLEPSGSGDIGSDDNDFNQWFKANVQEQKQSGYYYVSLRLTIGDIKSTKLSSLADICDNYGEGAVRNTQKQNIVLRFITQSELPGLYKDLASAGLGDVGANGVEDVMCCPGAETCNLGICLSKPLSIELTKSIAKSSLNLPELKDININVSGCPNSCGQHPVGAIGLYGVARGKGSNKAPHYNVLVGGRVEEGKTKLGEIIGYVPSKNIPTLINEMLSDYSVNKEAVEDYYDYLDRVGKSNTQDLVKKHGLLPTIEDDESYYIDWGGKEPFTLAGLGPGECGVGVFDLVETDMNDARLLLDGIKDSLGDGADPEDLSENLNSALVLVTKSMLITQGIEPKNDMDALNEFEKLFVTSNILEDSFKGLEKKGAQFKSGLLDKDGMLKGVEFVSTLLNEVNRLYDLMDDTLKFSGEIADKMNKALGLNVDKGSVIEESAPQTDSDVFMDLKGVACPINYVKAKIKMETMSVGQTMLLYLDDGEPIRNVPTSLKNDGQEILKMDNKGEYFELLVKKAV